jgi:hypothetical protein
MWRTSRICCCVIRYACEEPRLSWYPQWIDVDLLLSAWVTAGSR